MEKIDSTGKMKGLNEIRLALFRVGFTYEQNNTKCQSWQVISSVETQTISQRSGDVTPMIYKIYDCKTNPNIYQADPSGFH